MVQKYNKQIKNSYLQKEKVYVQDLVFNFNTVVTVVHSVLQTPMPQI